MNVHTNRPMKWYEVFGALVLLAVLIWAVPRLLSARRQAVRTDHYCWTDLAPGAPMFCPVGFEPRAVFDVRDGQRVVVVGCACPEDGGNP